MIVSILFIFGTISEIALAQTGNENKRLVKKIQKPGPEKFTPYATSNKKLNQKFYCVIHLISFLF
jgi:hypothetical protein